MSLHLSIGVLLLTAAFGFLTRWANICIVHAGERWLIRGRADVLADFFSCAAFSGLALLPLAWTMRGGVQLSPATMPTLALLGGGLLFGLGASLNGACAFGTVARIGAGELALLLALPGYAGGLAAGRALGAAHAAMSPSPVTVPDALGIGWLLVLAFVAALELRAVLRAPHAQAQAARRRRDRLALIAMSVCGGLLFAIERNSIYSRAVEPAVRWAFGFPGPFDVSGVVLMTALLAGSVLAALLRRVWRLRPPRLQRSLRSLAGGAVMGAGASLVPGGNDFLVLWGAPSCAADAFVALAAMVAGVLAGLWLGGARREPVRFPERE
jgi:hypothetical protein